MPRFTSTERFAIATASLNGATACYGDLPIEANPYTIGTAQNRAWEEAWQFALQQSVKEFLIATQSDSFAENPAIALNKVVPFVRK